MAEKSVFRWNLPGKLGLSNPIQLLRNQLLETVADSGLLKWVLTQSVTQYAALTEPESALDNTHRHAHTPFWSHLLPVWWLRINKICCGITEKTWARNTKLRTPLRKRGKKGKTNDPDDFIDHQTLTRKTTWCNVARKPPSSAEKHSLSVSRSCGRCRLSAATFDCLKH